MPPSTDPPTSGTAWPQPEAALADVLRRVGLAAGVQSAAETLLAGLAEPAGVAWLFVVQAERERWSLVAAAGHPPEEILSVFRSGLPYSQGVMGRAISQNCSIFVPHYPESEQALPELRSFGGACAYLPLRGASGLPWGGVALVSRSPRGDWDPALRALLERTLNDLSGTLERAVLLGHTVALAAISRLSEETLTPAEATRRAGRAVAAATHLSALGLIEFAGPDEGAASERGAGETPLDSLRLLGGWNGAPPRRGRPSLEERLRTALAEAQLGAHLSRALGRADAELGLYRGPLALLPLSGSGGRCWLAALRAGRLLSWSPDDRRLLEAAARAVTVAAERERAQAALNIQTQHTRLLLELSQRAYAAGDVLEAASAVLSPLLNALRASFAVFMQREGHDFVARLGVGTPPQTAAGRNFGLRFPEGLRAIELAAQAAAGGSLVSASPSAQGIPGAETLAQPERVGIASVVLRGPQLVEGLLVLFADGPRPWTPQETALLEAVGKTLSGVLDRLRREQEIQRSAREFEVQALMAERLRPHEEPHETAQVGLDACVELIGCDYAVYLDLALGPRVWSSSAPEALVQLMRAYDGQPLEGLPRRAAAQTEPLWCPDFTAEPDAMPQLVALGVRAAAYAAVLVDDAPVGVLMLGWFRKLSAAPPGADAALHGVAERLGRNLERAAHITQIQATREGALRALGVALEGRDFETQGHTERVVSRALRLGAQLSLSLPELDALRQGAYLHDIGKLMVPDAVLLKAGPLDDTEREQMSRHAQLGSELVASIPSLPLLARLVVRHHHERWDGGGYPDGLAGQAIPLAARIFSVVDVYDALTSQRPYKRAWSEDEARAELKAQAGRQFDPAVVAAFLAQASGSVDTPDTAQQALLPAARQAQPTRRSLDTLLERGLEIAGLADPEQVIVRALDLVAELLSVQAAAVWLGPGEDGQLELAYAWGDVGHSPPPGTRLSLGMGLIGRTAATGQVQRVQEYRSWPGRQPGYDVRGNVLAVPILRAQRVVGVLAVSQSSARELGTQDQLVLERLVQVIAVALLNTQRLAELEQLRERAEAAVRIDHLTGVGNRLALEQRFRQELARLRQQAAGGSQGGGGEASAGPLSVAVLDLVGFKAINDRYGHSQGDEVLRRVAALLSSLHPDTFRLGGDEFALLLPLDFRGATRALGRAIRRTESLGIGDRSVGANAGVAQWLPGTEDLGALLSLADQRMYRAKRAGLPSLPLDGLPLDERGH